MNLICANIEKNAFFQFTQLLKTIYIIIIRKLFHSVFTIQCKYYLGAFTKNFNFQSMLSFESLDDFK